MNGILEDKSYQFLTAFKWIYERFGVNFDQMLHILRLKSKIMARTERAQYEQRLNKKRKGRLNRTHTTEPTLFSMGKAISYLISSAFLMLYGFIFESPSTVLNITFTAGFIVQFLAVITSFPVLILDMKDLTALGSRPISSRTLSAAKTTLAILYMTFTSGSIYSLALIPFIAKAWLSVLPFMLLSIIASNILCVVFAYLLYGLVLKFYDGEKLKDMLSYFQIALTVAIMLGYQVIAQLQHIVDVRAEAVFHWWYLFFPPLWLSGFSATPLGGNHFLSGLVCLTLILSTLFLHFFYSGKMLEENMGKILSEGEVIRSRYEKKHLFQEKLAHFLLKKPQDRAFFLLGYAISSNDRKMKQSIYPLYVSMIIFPAIMVLNAWQESKGSIFQIFNAHPWLVFSLYFTSLSLGSVTLYVKRTEKPSGAWIFETLPIHSQKSAYKATALNIILRYVLLPTIGIVFITSLLAGPKQFINLYIMAAFTLLATFIALTTEGTDWPFSYELSYASGKRGILLLTTLLGAIFFVAIHLVCYFLLPHFSLYLLASVTTLATWIVWKYL